MDYFTLRSAILDGDHASTYSLVTAGQLRRIAQGESPIRAVRHPLGFICFPVLRGPQPEGICIHVFPRRRQPPRYTTSPYHCHSWDLLSFVLYGAVGNQPIDVVPGTTYRACEVRSGDGDDEVVPTDRTVDIHGRTPEFWRSGEYYSLPAGDFHASVLPEGDSGTGAATIVLGRYNPTRKDITLGGLDTPVHRMSRPGCTAGATMRIARAALRRIEAESVRVGRATVGAGAR